MKRHLLKGLFSGIALLLLLPICLWADMSLQIITPEGEIITSSPVVKGFFVDSSNNLNVLINGPLLFSQINPPIDVSAVDTSCTVSNPWDGTVTAQVPSSGTKTIEFLVSTPAQGGTISAVTKIPLPVGSSGTRATFTPSGNTGTFRWTINSGDVGTYLAAFRASTGPGAPTGALTSDMWVTLKLIPANTVTVNPPTSVTPTAVTPGVNANFTAYGASSNDSSILYSFSWGDTTPETWTSFGSATQSHTYAQGTYTLKVRTQGSPSGVISSNYYSTTVTVSPTGPPPTGEALVWTQWYTFSLNGTPTAPTTRVFIATVPANMTGFTVNIMGVTPCTEDVTVTWTFPDGRTFPPSGQNHVYQCQSMVNMSYIAQAGGWTANLPDQYIPPGQHTLTITSISNSSLRMQVN